MTKPTSKVIQISTCGVVNTNGTQCDYITTILCEDGSVWEQRNVSGNWLCILEAPKQEMDGSWQPLPEAPKEPELELISLFKGVKEELNDI